MKRLLVRIVIIVVALNLLMAAAGFVLKRRIRSMGGETSDELALAAIFDGIDMQSRADSFRGGSAQAIFGGIRLDLRAAQLDPAGGRLRLRAIFGGIELQLPEGWPVRVTGSRAIMGGYDHPFADDDPVTGPALELELEAIFGGVEVVTIPGDAVFTRD